MTYQQIKQCISVKILSVNISKSVMNECGTLCHVCFFKKKNLSGKLGCSSSHWGKSVEFTIQQMLLTVMCLKA